MRLISGSALGTRHVPKRVTRADFFYSAPIDLTGPKTYQVKKYSRAPPNAH
jgi:hypothetical protein